MNVKSLLKWPRNSFQILLILTVCLIMLYLFQISHLRLIVNMKFRGYQESNNIKNDAYNFFKNPTEKTFQGEKLIHIDLKGAPPKISYLLKFIPLIKSLGGTGMLIEYEDMFPYHDELENIKALNAYSLSDVADIVQTAAKHNLAIIPLIPTFSHFEFVLKLEQYKDFREVENNPQILCPNQKNVYVILKKMIDQVLKAHNTSKYIHIGCDEARFVGVCSKCQKELKEKKWRKDNIYFKHVKEIAEYVIKNHKGVKVIMWGDQFMYKNKQIIVSNGIPDLVEVMLWNYRPDANYFPKKKDMDVLVELFENVWIANAYKGATGSSQIVTNIDYHLENTKGWMDFIEEWQPIINFKGIALTGWQRYNHFAVLCELLPVGIPSLALNLQYLNTKEVNYHEKLKRTLKCILPINLNEIRNIKLSNQKCEFPGFKIYRLIHSFYNMVFSLTPQLAKMRKKDFSLYSLIHTAADPMLIHELELKYYERNLLGLKDLKNEMKSAMEEVYDQHTIDEWISTYVIPVQMRLEAAINILSAMGEVEAWPRRPFVNAELEATHFFNKICNKNETMGCAIINIY